MVEGRRDPFDLTGRTAVVTGAGGAIGRAVSVGLARQGARVVLVDQNETTVRAAAEEVGGFGEAAVVVGDTSSPESVEAILDETARAVERVDILVNNVGGGTHTLPEQMAFEELYDNLRINLHSSILIAIGFGRAMIAAGVHGSIINTASTCGVSAMGRGNFAFSIAKAGVIQMTRELAIEWGHLGIRVNAIAPCQLDTPGVLSMLDWQDPSGVTFGERVLAGIPLGRLATTEDMVGPVVFLASDAAAMVSGVVLPIDGGNTAANAASSIRRDPAVATTPTHR
ncbi:MAG TPA: SDR family NAD(P)-dependent oxidoreductase [Acidimicrobiales bacterium]|nr:SDR family NAD(P)-dependent oxidoreductase [Acidimicrobiales bacterium]